MIRSPRFKHAWNIMELNDEEIAAEDITEEDLKRQYKKMALKYHPDKNKSDDATTKFQDVSHSYIYLLNYIKTHDIGGEASTDDEKETEEEYNSYKEVIYSIIEKWLKKETLEEPLSKVVKNIISTVADVCETNIQPFMIQMEKYRHQRSSRRREAGRGEAPTFTPVPPTGDNTSVPAPHSTTTTIELRPTLKDLMENNLYKLTESGSVYIVPLWHSEITYEDTSGNEIIVKCSPFLPPHITLDEDNHLHIVVTHSIADILDKDQLSCSLEENADIHIPIERIQWKSNQIIILPQQGISKVNTNNIYDVSQKGDILVHLTLSLS